MQHTDVLVIGAGIVGAACAHALVSVGLSVRVIDARLGGATAAGMGHLVVMDDNPAELALSQTSLDLWHTWAPHMDAGCAFTPCGTLWLAANDAELQAAHDKRSTLQAHGIACDMLDAAALSRAEPALRPGLAGALKVQGDSVVYAPRAAQWLLDQAAAHGHLVLEQAEAMQIDGHTVTLRDGSQRSAGAIVLASGIHAPQLCPGLPLRPKKGHLVITDRYPGTVHHQLVELGYITSAHHSDGTSVAFNVQPRPRAVADRLVARVRHHRPRRQQRRDGAHAATGTRLPARPGRPQRHPHLDRFSRRHARQPAADWRAPRTPARVAGRGT